MENQFGHDFSRVAVHAGSDSEHSAEAEANRVSAFAASPPALVRDTPGMNLAATRIHTGQAAERSAHALHARAYAVGPHIVFAQDQYRPETVAGRQLLAHELTHTLQQRASGNLCVQKQEAEVATATTETAASVLPFGKGDHVKLDRLLPDELFGFAPNNISSWTKGVPQGVDSPLFVVVEATADRFQADTPNVAKSTKVPGTAPGVIANVSIRVERIGGGRFQIRILSGTTLLTSQEARATRNTKGGTVLTPVAGKPTGVPSADKPLSKADEFAKKGASPPGLEGPSIPAQQKDTFDAVTKPSRSKEQSDALQADLPKDKVPAAAGTAAPEESKLDKEIEDKLTTMVETVAGAVAETAVYKALEDQLSAAAEKQLDKFSTGDTFAAVTIGVVLAGGLLPGMAATGTEPPIKKSPKIPLTWLIKPFKPKPKEGEVVDKSRELKVSAQVTWKGSLDHPKEASIVLTFTKGEVEVAGTFKSTSIDPAAPVSPENNRGVEGGLSVKVPLGKEAPKKKEPTSAEKVQADKDRLEAEIAGRKHRYPAGSPEAKEAEMRERAEKKATQPFEFSGTTAIGAGSFSSPRLLQSFDVTAGPGKTPWNLDQLSKAIAAGFAASPGATLQMVAVFHSVEGDTVEAHRGNDLRRDDLLANVEVTKRALEQWLPTLKGRIQTSVQLRGTGRTFGLSGDIAAQLGVREVSVIFIPGGR